MRCEQSLCELTALLHHELSAANEVLLQTHLETCTLCRDEFIALKSINRALRSIIPIEPAASSRRALERHITRCIEEIPGSDSRSASRKPEPEWKVLDPKPKPLLPPAPAPAPEKIKALPQPFAEEIENKAGLSKPEVAALSPSARVVSARLESTRRHDSQRAAWNGAIVLLSICILILSGILVWTVGHAQPQNDVDKAQRAASSRRWNDRDSASARGQWSNTLISTQIKLNDQTGDAILHVLPHHDPRGGELCLIVYRLSDITAIQQNDKIDQVAFRTLIDSALVVESHDGKFSLPRELTEKYIGAARIKVLTLEERIEIWSDARLKAYLAGGPSFDPTGQSETPVANAFPPSR